MQENAVYIALWRHLRVKKKISPAALGGTGDVCGGVVKSLNLL